MLFEAKCTKSFSNNFSKATKFFSWNLLYIVHIYLKHVLLENKSFQLDIYVLGPT